MTSKIPMALLLCALPFFTYAAEYNVKTYCKKVADSVGGSAQIELGCREQENDAKASIPGKNATPKILKYCDQVAQSIGGSYQILSGCIDQEQDAQKKLGN
ncbi:MULTISPECIES: hypothetical protein [Pseudomonas syringae group]|uniref:Uncharacterized protein n=1 Tax=Pseudomonas coronafaciens pv. coronafaciens TaxID=235275 RepID=A0AAE6UKD2_9PSED|nr:MULTISPECIES: hypothetical protein [Pseudomonas syringae group]QGT80395.1 hypothetical protein GMO17_03985 [Pseudomonas coronafaciens pv. coronafaciens]QIQ73191.1 hypothetical protein HBB04_03593 [Pseudomonas coronafaciens]